MTKQRFHELVKRLHPDTSGDGRTLDAYRKVVAAWRRRKSRFHKCFCGRTILRINKHCQLHARMKATGVIAAVVLCLCLSIGGEFRMPTKPPLKKKVQRLSSPRGAELYSAVPMAIVTPPKSYALMWDYALPLPQPTIEFVIESRADFQSTWQVVGVTNKPPYPIISTAPQMMYRVGSRYR